jgi:hypothetical protein
VTQTVRQSLSRIATSAAFPVPVTELLTPVKWDTVHPGSRCKSPIRERCKVATPQEVDWRVCGDGDLVQFTLIELS